MRLLLASFSVTLLLSVPASASPIAYDNGAPLGPGLGYGVDSGYLLADDFMFPVDTLLTEIAGWSGDSWMILEGDTKPDGLVATGDSGAPINLRLTGGKRYWLGVLNGSLGDPCHNSAGGALTTRNGTLPAHYLSYPGGPLGTDSPDCVADMPYDLSSTFWGTDDMPVGGIDFAFELRGRTIPEPAGVLLGSLVAGVLAAARRNARRDRRAVLDRSR